MADKATDAAKQKAEEKGVDLSGLEGSGSGGKVTVEDVEKAEEKFLAFANPELGSYSATTYPDNNPSAPRVFYRNPNENPDGSDAQMVTEEEYAKLNYDIGGIMALTRKGG